MSLRSGARSLQVPINLGRIEREGESEYASVDDIAKISQVRDVNFDVVQHFLATELCL